MYWKTATDWTDLLLAIALWLAPTALYLIGCGIRRFVKTIWATARQIMKGRCTNEQH